MNTFLELFRQIAQVGLLDIRRVKDCYWYAGKVEISVYFPVGGVGCGCWFALCASCLMGQALRHFLLGGVEGVL